MAGAAQRVAGDLAAAVFERIQVTARRIISAALSFSDADTPAVRDLGTPPGQISRPAAGKVNLTSFELLMFVGRASSTSLRNDLDRLFVEPHAQGEAEGAGDRLRYWSAAGALAEPAAARM